jgi:undecaprenyl-phosphate 4-deoxy-4-formamido-L-arabinose transferase
MAGPEAEYAVEFSAVISCYREERTIREFHRRLRHTLADLGRSFEIVYVNDGSRDGTLSILREIYAEDPSVSTVIDLFDNSGAPAAVAAGCVAARGRHFIFLDSDLQLDPEELPKLVREFDRPVDFVNGVRRERRDRATRATVSRGFNAALRWLSGAQLQDLFCTFKVVRGELVRGLGLGPYRGLYPVQLAIAARDCAEVEVEHHPRPEGSSNWRLAALFGLALDTVLGSTRYPFQVVGWLGLAFAAAGLLAVAVASLFGAGLPSLGWMIVVLALTVNLGAVVLVAEYLVRLHGVLLGSPRYIVRSCWQRQPGGN